MVTKSEPYGDRILMRGGSLVTGDGRTFLDCASIRIRKGLIIEVMAGIQDCVEGETVIATGGALMLPGFINGHAHATILGPSMPSGSQPLPPTEVEWQRNRHLLSGTTSLINVCGLAMMDERDGQLAPHPMDIHMTSAHTPHSISAADQIDGNGLSPRHRSARIEDLIRAGCRVLGEAGGGQTLGGGAQDYRFIPDAIEERTGQRITVLMARRLKEAVLGRRLDGVSTASDGDLMNLAEEAQLQDRITPQALRSLLEERVLAPVKNALLGIEEIAEAATEFGLPAIFHHAAPTAATLLSLKRRLPNTRMIAAHANHPSFLPDEAVETARQLKALGVTIDVSTLDVIDTRFRNRPDNLDVLIEAGLVDTISTDYAGGDWDTIPSALHRMTRVHGQSLPQVAALATGNVARVFPEIFGDRGLIAPGKRADIVITDLHNVSKVRHVFIAGKAHVLDGRF
ncbi:amidohydrolase family protein [Rhizobium rhizophilum]|uniref:Amidohydrolase n=1 Tax=Rhizobium rhizophilum TaxID=1850373 RepID=A0ABY2QRU7_9HYPH|nr:amidohydrolase family protein [Rhizobium rhizophilum]THV12747.1 amidohydrolase [Rhizobium rhizophilum]